MITDSVSHAESVDYIVHDPCYIILVQYTVITEPCRPHMDVLLLRPNRVVLSEAVDWCICFTQNIQHGGEGEPSRPQGPKNVHNFSMTVRSLSWACGHGAEMLMILKKLFSTWLLPDIFRYDSPKKCPTILYAINLWLKPVPATDQYNMTTKSIGFNEARQQKWARYGNITPSRVCNSESEVFMILVTKSWWL